MADVIDFPETEANVASGNWYHNRMTPKNMVFGNNVLLYILWKKGKDNQNLIIDASEYTDGGKHIEVFLEVGKSNVGVYGRTTKIDRSRRKIYNRVLYVRGGWIASNTIDLKERVENKGTPRIIRLVQGKLENIRKTIRDKMGGAPLFGARDDYSDGDNLATYGLDDLFNQDPDFKFGDISPAEYSRWIAHFDDTAAVISFRVMQEIYRRPGLTNHAKDKPDLFLTTDVLLDAYEASLQQQQRFRNEKLVKAGFDNIQHKQMDMVADKNQADGRGEALNTRNLHYRAEEGYNFTRPTWERDTDQPDTYTAHTRFIGAFYTDDRSNHYRRDGLAPE